MNLYILTFSFCSHLGDLNTLKSKTKVYTTVKYYKMFW